jgi:hypothetical protein
MTTDGKPIYINLSIVLTMMEIRGGTRIAFPGGKNDFVDVKESPEHILSLSQGGH